MLLPLVTLKGALTPSGMALLPRDNRSSPTPGATLQWAPQGCVLILLSAHPMSVQNPGKGRALLPRVSCSTGTASLLFGCPAGQLLGPHPIHGEPVARGSQHVAGELWPLLVAVNRQHWVRGEGLAPVDTLSSGEHEEQAESHLLPCCSPAFGMWTEEGISSHEQQDAGVCLLAVVL